MTEPRDEELHALRGRLQAAELRVALLEQALGDLLGNVRGADWCSCYVIDGQDLRAALRKARAALTPTTPENPT